MTSAWDLISVQPKEPLGVLTDAFVMKFSMHLNWNLLSKNYVFSTNMMRMFQHRIYWPVVLKRQKLHESLLREMAPNFDNDSWAIISRYQVLSESFISDFASKVDWEYIILYQSVTGRFLRDYYKYYTPFDERVVE